MRPEDIAEGRRLVEACNVVGFVEWVRALEAMRAWFGNNATDLLDAAQRAERAEAELATLKSHGSNIYFAGEVDYECEGPYEEGEELSAADPRHPMNRAATAERERDEAREVLREVEWCVPTTQGLLYIMSCPSCKRLIPNHAPDCRLSSALGGAK